MERFRTSARQAFRRLIREWRYSAAVVLVLAIGIGPTAAISSVVYDVLMRPLEYRAPEQLGFIRFSTGLLIQHPGLTIAEVADLRKTGVFESVEAESRLSEVSFGSPPDLVSLSQLSITGGMLAMLGVSPVIGRDFVEADIPVFPPPPPPPPPGTRPAPPPPPIVLPPQKVLLDYGTWQRHFTGSRDVLGRFIQLNGRASEIIGVLPNGFRLVTGRAAPQRVDVYTPMAVFEGRGFWGNPTLVRLKQGVTFAQAQAALDRLGIALKEQYPAVYQDRPQYTVNPLLDDMTRATKPALRAAVAAVFLLFIIAFANATALVIARLKTREVDFAVRSAMGARSVALVEQVLIESGVLAVAGAAAGTVLALLTTLAIRAIIPRTVPRWEEIGVGWDQLLYSSSLTFAGLLLLGLVPALRIAKGVNFDVLRSGSVQGGKAEGLASRFALVGSQMAFTVVLAFGCVQLARSAVSLRRVDLGFDPNVLTVRTPYDFQRHSTRTARAELYQRIRDRVRQIPGVTSVGVVTHVPLSGATMMDGYEADLTKEVSFAHHANYQAVTPGYFATMQISIIEGRDFTDAEDATMRPVIIVDQSLARTLFPGERNIVGRTLKLGWGLENAQIVGVVRHVRMIDVGHEVRPQIYTPIGNLFQNAGNIIVRASGDPRLLTNAITSAILEVGPGRAVANVAMLTDNVHAATSTQMAVTGLVALFALSAGLLSAVGLYLVIAFVVHQRRRSTAIRSALGASPRQVMWDNYRTTGIVIGVALVLGVVLSLSIAPFLTDLLHGVAARDAFSLAAALVLAGGAGVLGTYFPVRRAAKANVLNVLRES